MTTKVSEIEVIAVFDSIFVQFPRDFVRSFNTNKNKRASYSLSFSKRTLQRFYFKNTSEVERSRKTQRLHLNAAYVNFSNRFGVIMTANDRQRLNS